VTEEEVPDSERGGGMDFCCLCCREGGGTPEEGMREEGELFIDALVSTRCGGFGVVVVVVVDGVITSSS